MNITLNIGLEVSNNYLPEGVAGMGAGAPLQSALVHASSHALTQGPVALCKPALKVQGHLPIDNL